MPARAGVLTNGNTTPCTPASSTRFAVHASVTGSRANGTAGRSRVASTMLRTVSSVSGECSSSSQRKWKPAVAARAAMSRLLVVMVQPKTGSDSRSRRLTGLSQGVSIVLSTFFASATLRRSGCRGRRCPVPAVR